MGQAVMISPGMIEFHDVKEPGPLKDNEGIKMINKHPAGIYNRVEFIVVNFY
jgi:hypothetical protein